MRIAVIDTNIFIDLIKTELLPKLFETEFLIHTTAEVVNELLDHQQRALVDFIRDKKLIVCHFLRLK
jgi:predicted nucleic acid-binding protein